MTVESAVQTLAAQFENVDAEFPEEHARNSLEELMNSFKIPETQAIQSVRSSVTREFDIEEAALFQAASALEDVAGDGNWFDVEVKFVDEWEPRADSMVQAGIIADETARMKFTSWETNETIPRLEVGKSYRLSSVVSDVYQGQASLKITKATDVDVLSKDIDAIAPRDIVEAMAGTVVSIERGSGLIKRCTQDDCTRALRNGRCSDHGSVEGEFDLRIKATIDNGSHTERVVFNREHTEAVLGYDLEKAVELAMEYLDLNIVAAAVENELLGRSVAIEFTPLDSIGVVKDWEFQNAPTDDEIDQAEQAADAVANMTTSG